MTNYRRDRTPGATWFFTVALAERQRRLLVEHVGDLRIAFAAVKQRHPFRIDAMVVLPDHLHALWTLPDGDADYGVRWGLVKAAFSRRLPRLERRSRSRLVRGRARDLATALLGALRSR